MNDDCWFNSRLRQRIFSNSKRSYSLSAVTQPPICLVSGANSPEAKRPEGEYGHFCVESLLRISGSLPPFFSYVLMACKKDNVVFTFIRQELPCSEQFLCYFQLSNTDRKCAASADINTCCLRSVCPSRATCIVSTIKTVERKPRVTVLPCITVVRVCQRRCNRAVTGSLCISAGHCNGTGLGTHPQLITNLVIDFVTRSREGACTNTASKYGHSVFCSCQSKKHCNILHVCTMHQQYQGKFLLFQTDAHNYKIIGILKQNSDCRSDMFRFTQEPSSGSYFVLS